MDDTSDTTLGRACEALLTIMLNDELDTGVRIDAAEAVLSYEAPLQVAAEAKAFLTAVFEDEDESVTTRLKALKLARKCEAPRAFAPSQVEDVRGRRIARNLAVAKRRMHLMKLGMWPPLKGWTDDLDALQYEPVSIDPSNGDERLRAARLRRQNGRQR